MLGVADADGRASVVMVTVVMVAMLTLAVVMLAMVMVATPRAYADASVNVSNASNASVNVSNASVNTQPVFIDEETAELQYRVGGSDASEGVGKVGSSGSSFYNYNYNSRLRNALREGDALRDGSDVYCWQCVLGTYTDALEGLPLPLRVLLTPQGEGDTPTNNYTKLLDNPYAKGIDAGLLSSVVVRLNSATLLSSTYPYAATLVTPPPYPATNLETLRGEMGVRLRQLNTLCGGNGSGSNGNADGDAYNGYRYVDVGANAGANVSGANVSGANVSGANASANVSGANKLPPPYSYCDYAEWVQMHYVMESVPTLLISHDAMSIAMFVVDFAEELATMTAAELSPMAVRVLPLSSRAIQGMEVLKESIYGNMLKDYTAGRGQGAYLGALTLQRIDALYQGYDHASGSSGTSSASTSTSATPSASTSSSQYWQRTAHEYAKESYALIALGEAPVVGGSVSIGGECLSLFDTYSPPSVSGTPLFPQGVSDFATDYGSGDGFAESGGGYDASIICLRGLDSSDSESILVVNTNRSFQYSCSVGAVQVGDCLGMALRRAVADEVLSLLGEVTPTLFAFKPYEYSPIWATMTANSNASVNNANGTNGTNGIAALNISLNDILGMNKQALLLYITYQLLATGNYIG